MSQHHPERVEHSGAQPRSSGLLPRRAMTAALPLLNIAMIVLSLMSDGSAFGDSGWLVCLTLWLVLWGALRSMTRAVGERPSSGLDEREQELRNRSAFVGYQFAVASGMLVVLLMVALQNNPAFLEKTPALLTTLMLGACAVPTVLLAWNRSEDDGEPDEYGAPKNRIRE